MYSDEHFLVTWGGRLANSLEQWQTGLRFGRATGVEQQVGLVEALETIGISDIFADLAAFHENQVANCSFPGYTFLEWVKIAPIGVTGHYIGDPAIFSPPQYAYGRGDATSSPAPQLSWVATTLSGESIGKANRGRMFFPMVSGNLGTDGRLSSAFGGAMGGLVKSMVNAVAGEMNQLLYVVQPRIYSQAAIPQSKVITKINIGRAVDTQRSRRRSLDEAYTETVL